jgi:hypothetical protein
MSKPPPRPRSRAAAKTLEAGVAASLVLGKLSCPVGDRAPTTVAIPTAAPTSAPGQAPEEAPLLVHVRLREAVVLTNAPARRILYTWTTPDQVEALAKDRVLLTRTESPVHGPSFYDQVLAERAASGDALAKKLRTEAFARARHAWANPWATVLGWEGESYGDELIVVELKPEAWTAVLATSTASFRVVDADNHEVPMTEAVAHPERIGAVYFVHDAPAKGPPGSFAGPADRPSYREYVLCNEAMIARWSIGPATTAPAVTASAELAERLAVALQGKPQFHASMEWNKRVATETWRLTDPPAGLYAAYEAAIAFPNTNYAPTAQSMTDLGARLRMLKSRVPSLTHEPVVAPPSASAKPLPPPVPRKVKPQTGTWARRGGTF